MESRALKSIVFAGILLQLCVGCIALRTWDYEFLSLTATSSDESKLNISAKIERVGRYERTITSSIVWQFDTDENTMVEISFYTSNSGSENDFSEMPYKIPPSSFNEFIDKFYNDLIYNNFKSCSNLPKIKGKFKAPFPRNTYVYNRCQPDGFGLPDYLPAAYYKFCVKLTGEVELNLRLFLRITSKTITKFISK